MTLPKFFASRQIGQVGTDTVTEIYCESIPGETRDEFISRYSLEKFPPPPVEARPTAPVIAPLLDEPYPKIDPVVIAAAAKLESSVIFQTFNLNTAEALSDCFDDADFIMATGSMSGVPVVSTFRDLALRLENFPSLCANPVVGMRLRAPAKRRNVVLSFPGISLTAQVARALYLGKILSLNLCIYNPMRLAVEAWYSASTTPARNARFAKAACQLGFVANDQFSPSFMVAMPCASSVHQPPAAAAALLGAVGISRPSDRENLILYKAQKKKPRAKNQPNEK
jgi:hypothetical protein